MAVAMPCPDRSAVEDDPTGIESGHEAEPGGTSAQTVTEKVACVEMKTEGSKSRACSEVCSAPTSPASKCKETLVTGIGYVAECSEPKASSSRDHTSSCSLVAITRNMRPRALSSGSGSKLRNSGTNADSQMPFDITPWTQNGIGSMSVFSTGPSESGVQCGGAKVCVGSVNTVSTGNAFARMNRLENFKLRIRKGSVDVGSRRGPMVARHPQASSLPASPETPAPTSTLAVSNIIATTAAAAAAAASEIANKCASPPNRCRTPPLVLGEGSHSRKRSPSITRSRPSSPSGGGSGRRPPSPGALDPSVMEAVKRRVRRVQKARLYLLQQPGPNSFLVGGDSPEHKYRVVIGPQSCSCGRGPHCLHLLFVMLRVFQVPENDTRIYAKELKNFEVESLFQHYQQRRNSRVSGMPEDIPRDSSMLPSNMDSNPSPLTEGSSRSVADTSSVSDNKHAEEEEVCPICLLEMVDGESLVVCTSGCRNKLHLHCMAIWAAECTQQGEYVLCPLCRQPWCDEVAAFKTSPLMQNIYSNGYKHWPGSLPISKNVQPPLPWSFQPLPGPGPGPGSPKTQLKGGTLISCGNPSGALAKVVKKPQYLPLNKAEQLAAGLSTEWKRTHVTNSPTSSEITLPCSGIIPPEQMGIAAEWIKVFGLALVSCLYSRDWKDREMALRKLVNEVISVYYSGSEERQQKVTWCCAKILAMVIADPVFKVYLGCIRCFRVLVNHAAAQNWSQSDEFHELIRPVIKTLLKKCADRNKRTSHLSAEVLVELARGSSGEHMSESTSWNLDGLEIILSCILEHFTVESVSWQWLAGRLLMLNTLLQIFPEEFCLKYVPLYANDSGYKLNNFNRLLSIIEFSFKALQSSHSTVSKLARHVFVVSSSMTTAERGMINQILEMISDLDISLQSRLKKRLQVAIENQSQTVNCSQKKCKPIRCSQVNAASNKIETQGSSTIPSSSSSPPVRPKDLPLESSVKNKKGARFQQAPAGQQSPSPSAKRWINSGSKLSNLFSRNKKVDDLLPMKPELNGNCDSGCDHGLIDSPSTPTHDCICHTSREDDNMSFFSRVMGCVPNSPHDRPMSDKGEPVPLPEGEWAQGSAQKIPEYRAVESETLVRPGGFSIQTGSFGEIKLTTYMEDIHWKRGPLLGTGAYSTCFQARDVESGTIMAVKQVPYCRNSEEEQACVEAGIRKEILTMSKLCHPNVLTILGATRQGSHFNIFVEWMAGGSVAGLLDSYGPFKQCVITEYTKQILEGLNYLHENHILHRDLKGANLLVDSTGKQLRIGDFGASARLESQATISGEFQGQLLGTIAFMAPEVLRGEDYGRSCDIWSVGCCMIEMATTKAPWKENRVSNHLALMYKIASSKDPPFVPDNLGAATKDLALKCLQVRSDLRPSAKELLSHYCFRTLVP